MRITLAITSLLLIILFLQPAANAQLIDPSAFGYYNEALRFSQTTFGGTARIQAIGGAGVALGGDMSSANINPAGLGYNRKSEFSITPTFNFNNTQSAFLGENTSDGRFNLNFNNLGVIFASPRDGLSKFKGGSFAISLTRVNDFQNAFSFSGVNEQNSLVDFFLDQSNGAITWDFLDGQGNGIFDINAMAYYAYLINPDFEFDPGTRDTYYSFIPVSPISQGEEIVTRGSQYQWNLAYGGNYDDRLYFGLNLGIQSVRFEQDKDYTEQVLNSAGLPMDNIFFRDELRLNGTGINLTAGLSFRATDNLSIGVSATTPTIYRLTDAYRAEMNVQYNNFVFRESDYITGGDETEILLTDEFFSTETIESAYTLQTPFRINTGIAYFLGKRGFISADLEMVGYNQAVLRNSDVSIDFTGDNNTISNLYKSAVNLRLGAEIRNNNWRYRIGGAFYQDPFQANTSIDEQAIAISRKFLTGGLGYRDEDFYFDFTLVANLFENSYAPYFLSNGEAPVAEVNNSRVRSVISFGVFF